MAERRNQSACPENLRSPFTRSLSDVLSTDYLATLNSLRQLYIPRHSPDELACFPQALDWVRENLEVFQNAGFGIKGTGLKRLPPVVRPHECCIAFLLFFEDQLSGMPPAQAMMPVTYDPVTPEWESYVRDMLDPHFERYTKWLLETGHLTLDEVRASASDHYSTTRHLALVKLAFYSNWREHRQEASDLLTAELWLRYLVKLQRKSESCINPK